MYKLYSKKRAKDFNSERRHRIFALQNNNS